MTAAPRRAPQTVPRVHLLRNIAVLVVASALLIVFFAPINTEAVDAYKTPRGYSVFANVSPTYLYFKCGMVWGFEGKISIMYIGQPEYRLPNNTGTWQFTCG